MRAGLFRAPMLRCSKRKAAFEKRQLSDLLALPYTGHQRGNHQAKGVAPMTTIMTRMRTAAEKRAAYNRTVDEISRLPLDVALDLGIFREDAHKIAYSAVYGR
jgi:uncharacterized protein YjiS (DUF1127 family)